MRVACSNGGEASPSPEAIPHPRAESGCPESGNKFNVADHNPRNETWI